MPPSSENICKQSTQYHFVNDFLYRPVNTEEANSRPNVTLRYGDRYYPGSSSETDYSYDESSLSKHQQKPAQDEDEEVVEFRQRPQPALRQRFPQQQQQQQRQQQPQPTQQHVLSTPRPLVLQQQPQQFVRQLSSPSPNQVFHSSEEVNIPLQQRRPIVLQQQRPNFQLQQQQNEFDFRRK